MDLLGSWTDLAMALAAIVLVTLIAGIWSRREERCISCQGLGCIYVNSCQSYKCLACWGTGKRR